MTEKEPKLNREQEERFDEMFPFVADWPIGKSEKLKSFLASEIALATEAARKKERKRIAETILRQVKNISESSSRPMTETIGHLTNIANDPEVFLRQPPEDTKLRDSFWARLVHTSECCPRPFSPPSPEEDTKQCKECKYGCLIPATSRDSRCFCSCHKPWPGKQTVC